MNREKGNVMVLWKMNSCSAVQCRFKNKCTLPFQKKSIGGMESCSQQLTQGDFFILKSLSKSYK